MKVIKKGRKQNGWAKEFECTGDGSGNGGCGAILLVEQTDIFKTSKSFQYDIDYYNTFKCPDCNTMTVIRESLPFIVKFKSE